ncbi:conserved Plasmodium protein, unknown function [Plasmodium malariae]|uniref:Uncharacterized protein n=1 Tax=Plasmodium malariae TaxID=5858 RepID=A0A1A8X771_PLAMA|nr:conserved Plasmodium protein, unknown function [Plasmodium malariae]
MNYVKLSLHSYPVKCYGKTYKVSNTLKLKGIGLKSLDEEEIRNIFKKLDIRCMAYLVDKEDIIYLEFYKKKECSQIFSFFNKVMKRKEKERKRKGKKTKERAKRKERKQMSSS